MYFVAKLCWGETKYMIILPCTLPSQCDVFFSSNDINGMSDWPKLSGDLMPLEQTWCEDRLHEVFNCGELWCVVREMWLNFVEVGSIVNITPSLPQSLNFRN